MTKLIHHGARKQSNTQIKVDNKEESKPMTSKQAKEYENLRRSERLKNNNINTKVPMREANKKVVKSKLSKEKPKIKNPVKNKSHLNLLKDDIINQNNQSLNLAEKFNELNEIVKNFISAHDKPNALASSMDIDHVDTKNPVITNNFETNNSKNPDLSFLLKNLKVLKCSDEFSGWEINTSNFLRDYSNIPESVKVKAVLSKLEGEAAEIIGSKEFTSVQHILNALSLAYKKNPFSKLKTIKQQPTENVQDYTNKFKILVDKVDFLKNKSNDESSQKEMIHYYIEGLLPYYKTQLQISCPLTFDEAVKKAIMYEEYNPQPQSTQKTINKLANIQSNDENVELLNQLKETNKNFQNVMTRLNVLEKEIRYKPYSIKSSPNNNSPRNQKDYNHNQYFKSQSNHSNFNTNENKVKCFGCGGIGHTFSKCKSTPDNVKKQIRSNLYKNNKMVSNQFPLNYMGVTTTPPSPHKQSMEEEKLKQPMN